MDKKCVRKFGSLMKGKTDFGEGSAYHFSTVILRNNLSEFVKNIQVVMLSYMAVPTVSLVATVAMATLSVAASS